MNLCSSSVKQRERELYRSRAREMKEEAGEHRAPGPPPTCSTSHLAVRARPAVGRAGACTCPPPHPPPPPLPSTPLPPRGEKHYQIQSPSARGAMAAAAAALDSVDDAAEHESGTTSGETDTARARYLNARSFTRSVCE